MIKAPSLSSALINCCFLLAACIVSCPTDVRATVVRLTASDVEHALALSRWPHSDADRALFHQRYAFAVHGQTRDSWAVDKIEVITEFRRIELMAEEHARLNDIWGRGGQREVEEAMRPWRGRLSILVHLVLRAGLPYVGDVPPVEMAVDGTTAAQLEDSRRSIVYANCGNDQGCPVIGAAVEATFDAASVGQTMRSIRVLWNDEPLARTSIDFGALD